jgi:hypothetical protein
MKKFIVHTRPIPGHAKDNDAPIIVEVEGELIHGVEDASVLWLPNGEFRFRITQPKFLYEPGNTKDKSLMPPIYHSHSIYDTSEQASKVAEKLVFQSFQFALRKYGTTFTIQEMETKLSEITSISL